MRTTPSDVLTVVNVKVIELCFSDAAKAPEVAARIAKDHPSAVYRILTDSNLQNNSSVLHVHVLADKVDDVVGRHPYIKGSGGVMLVTALSSANN